MEIVEQSSYPAEDGPLVARALSLSTGVAGAWIGTSEFADAAGLAAAQTYGDYAGNVAGISGHPDAAVKAFTLMKVIGRDMWIGVWAFVLSLVAATRWERTGIESRAGAGEIWRRFPKFVLGFLLARFRRSGPGHSPSHS